MKLPAYTVFLPTGPRHGKGWHVKFRYAGRQIMRSLRTTDRAEADRAALELVRRVVEPAVVWAPEVDAAGPKVADVVLVYLHLPHPSPATRAQNVRALCRILQARFGGERSAVMQLPVAVCNARTLDHYVRARQGGRIRRDRILSCNLGINSVVGQAKGVVTAKALAAYREACLEMPDVSEWASYPALPEPRRGRGARKFTGADGVEVTVWMEDGVVRWESSTAVHHGCDAGTGQWLPNL